MVIDTHTHTHTHKMSATPEELLLPPPPPPPCPPPPPPSYNLSSSSPFSSQTQQTTLFVPSRICLYYLIGQLFQASRASLWWGLFGLACFSVWRCPMSVAASRAAFSCGLLLASQAAAPLTHHLSMRLLLLTTTIGRIVVWSILIPVAAFCLLSHNQNGGHSSSPWLLFVFLMLLFLDGLQVSVGNALDLDTGGLEVLSAQYDVPVSDSMRSHFSSRYQLAFDFSLILLTVPLTGLIAYFSRDLLQHEQESVLWLTVALVFGALSSAALLCYLWGLPMAPVIALSEGSSLCTEYLDGWRDVKQACAIAWRDQTLRWRLVFFAMEAGLEDTMVCIILPRIALMTSESPPLVALCTVSFISAGKLGSLCAKLLASRLPALLPADISNIRSYARLFRMIWAGSLSTLLLPLAQISNNYGYRIAITSLGSFFFFAFCAAPKIGLSSLLLGLLSSSVSPPDNKIFGFFGCVLTVMDLAVVAMCSAAFVVFPETQRGLLWSLLAISLSFVLYGNVQYFLGLATLSPHHRDADHRTEGAGGRARREFY
eukprot:GHVS01098595.1.p1 GENE.GHVS01098595.1~~GHVS01098595.1.p1  ORF type:complete len:541 (-),score=79.50 GHVS01098595.1:224-1846(-)